MRARFGWLVVVVAGTAVADPALPALVDAPHSAASLAKSRTRTAAVAKRLEEAPFTDAPAYGPMIAELRTIVAAEPADASARFVLAKAYRADGNKPAAYAILGELKTSACDDCLAALINAAPKDLGGNGVWTDEDATDPAFVAVVSHLEGRKSAITAAAADLVATMAAQAQASLTDAHADLTPALRHLSAPVVRVVGGPHAGTYRGRAGFTKWLESTPGAFDIATKPLMTCDKTCCRFLGDAQGTDTTYYLDKVCFTARELVLSLSMH
jgi:hypothetical protein